MKNIKKIDTKKAKSKNVATEKARLSLAKVGSKAVSGCPELRF